jgi:polar amino acid transport system substrate-binding protein
MPPMAKPWLMTTTIGLLAACVTLAAQSSGSSGGGALRAAYLKANPAHAVADPAGGELRGVAVDLARELARRRGVAAALMGLDSPQAVLDAVHDGKADIGFVAYNPERAGAVEFTQPYLLVQQTFIVAATSTIRAVADLDRTGRKIGATQGDSIALYLRRNLKQAQLVEQPALTPAQVLRLLADGTVDAFGANRQRLTDFLKGAEGVRLLPDDLYGVEQTIIVPAGRREALDGLNVFIDDVRRSGFIDASIRRSGVIGIAVAPPAK